MYTRSFLCEEAKIKQRTPLKKEFCEIGEEAIWESRFTSFFFLLQLILQANTWPNFYRKSYCFAYNSAKNSNFNFLFKSSVKSRAILT